MKSLTRVLLATSAMVLAGAAQAQDLTIWGLQAFNEAADQYIGETVKAFGAERGINAEYVVVPANVLNERLAAAFEGGQPPDVFMQVGGQAQYYAALGLTLPHPEILEEMRAVEGGIYEGMVSQAVFNTAKSTACRSRSTWCPCMPARTCSRRRASASPPPGKSCAPPPEDPRR